MRGAFVAVVLVLVTGCTAASDQRAAPSSSRSPASSVPADPADVSCADPPEPAPSLPVPAGAVAARLCEAGSFRWQPPQQALTENIDALLEVVDAQPRVVAAGRYCTDQGGTGFDLRLAYRDGTVLSVPGDTGGCGELDVAGTRHEGASDVLDAFVDGIRAQRTETEPSFQPVRLSCGPPSEGPRLSAIREPRRLVRAVSCWRENADEPGPFRSSRISDSQLRLLLEDLDRRSVRQRNFTQPACQSSDRHYWQDMVGQTDWGDIVTIRGVCTEFQVELGTFWTAGSKARRVLERLRERAHN